MAHASKELGPWLNFSGGRNVVWFGHMWSGRRMMVWLKWGAFSIGRRFPKSDGWPE